MPRGPSDTEFENVISQIVTDLRDPPDSQALSEYGVVEVGGGISSENFITFKKAESSPMLAVDGGSATILDAGSFTVAALRVGQAFYNDRNYIAGKGPEMHLLHLSTGELAKAYSIFFTKTVGGDPPDTPRGLEEALGRIRALLEWKHVEDILGGDIQSGTVLAFDGALWAGIKGIGEMLARIVAMAREKGIILCGISKKSMLTYNSRPLIPAVQMAGDSIFPDSLWHYPIDAKGYGTKLFGQIHVAKLHPHSKYTFRIDLSLPEGVTPEEALGKLAYHANDPTYAGYPYPLARVHNDVALSRSEVEDLRSMLRSRAIRQGMDPGEWQMTFQNFHDVLDMSR
ncbi:MAG: DNA double-strand break repair nuclease NurA [Thermoplasmata archaeon]|nr:DNA double-strand break repair nuclease NurA [Thermoplasmata archaeon]